jgi:hypothetical protein
MTMTMAYVIAGAILIVAGRKVFWLFLGLLCFLAAMTALQRWFPEISQTTLVLASLGIGGLGAGIGMMAQKTAVWIGGFVGGGFLAVMLVRMMTQGEGSTTLVAFLLGGVVGILLARILFKWVMIVVSSAIGALVICKVLDTEMLPGTIVFGILLLAGVAIQGGFLWRGKSSVGRSGPETRRADKDLPEKPAGG